MALAAVVQSVVAQESVEGLVVARVVVQESAVEPVVVQESAVAPVVAQELVVAPVVVQELVVAPVSELVVVRESEPAEASGPVEAPGRGLVEESVPAWVAAATLRTLVSASEEQSVHS